VIPPADDLAARTQGWVWWLALVAVLGLVALLLWVLRRRLLRPMSHTPSDTTDAWTEAGRRLSLKSSDADGDAKKPKDGGPP